MRIAVATCEVMPSEFTDDQRIVDGLAARGADVTYEPWTADIDWAGFDLVLVRSPWDYSLRHAEFVAWADGAGDNLHNSAALMRWNLEKTYLGDLQAAGLDVIETAFAAPGEEWAGDEREVVVKPAISAGGRHTGRFSPGAHDQARELVADIQASGRTAMIQPFQPSVDDAGETAMVFIDGELSHTLHKRAVLRPDEVAPMRDEGIMVAEVMYEPDLVTVGGHDADELEVANRVLAHVSERFDYLPLYARVDMIRDADGKPMVLELEAIEPNLYFSQVPEAADRLVAATLRRAG